MSSSRKLSSGQQVASALESSSTPLPVKRGRGRPKGSKTDKPSADESSAARKTHKVTKPKPPKTKKAVNAILTACGVENLWMVSRCLRAGILNGAVKLLKPEDDPDEKYGLDQILTEAPCFMCGKDVKCTVRDVLYQPDYGGNDYENWGEYATLRCDNEECPGIYVTEICCGDPGYNCGKFHNHCTACPMFGMCIGDYRHVHCPECGDHYHGTGGGGCYNCSASASD